MIKLVDDDWLVNSSGMGMLRFPKLKAETTEFRQMHLERKSARPRVTKGKVIFMEGMRKGSEEGGA